MYAMHRYHKRQEGFGYCTPITSRNTMKGRMDSREAWAVAFTRNANATKAVDWDSSAHNEIFKSRQGVMGAAEREERGGGGIGGAEGVGVGGGERWEFIGRQEQRAKHVRAQWWRQEKRGGESRRREGRRQVTWSTARGSKGSPSR